MLPEINPGLQLGNTKFFLASAGFSCDNCQIRAVRSEEATRMTCEAPRGLTCGEMLTVLSSIQQSHPIVTLARPPLP